MRKHPINRYRTAAGIEAQYQPGSHGRVLLNLPGIAAKRRKDREEFESFLKAQERYVSLIAADTQFTAQLICRMHRDWLGKIYSWAGTYPTVEMAKENLH